MAGHLFIVRGDLTRLACDAILIPSGLSQGRTGHVRRQQWTQLLGDRATGDGFVTDPPSEQHRVVLARDGSGIDSPAIWVGHAGAAGQAPEWYAAAIEAFLVSAAEPGRRTGKRPLADARPLVAFPLVGTGAGGASDRRGLVVLEVMRAVKRVLARSDVDAVLVLNTEENFSAAQQARQMEFGDAAWAELDEGHRAVAEALATRAREGSLVAFVGAGASVGAGLPSWSELLERLAAHTAFQDGREPISSTELQRLDARDAGAVLQRRLGGREKLAAAIQGEVATDRLALMHQLVASIPIDEAVTTNYDLCLENAFADAGSEMRVLPRQPVAGARRWMVKLHGSVDDTSRIVLSRDDYLRFEGDGVALAGVVQALLLTRHMLFIGYSLSDDNFHRLVHQVRGVLGPPSARPDVAPFATALSPRARGLIEEVWTGDVDYVSTATESDDDPRRVAILLDMVAAHAAPPAGHLLDDSYSSLFTDDELDLRRELLEVWSLLDRPGVEIPKSVSDAVRSALSRLGRPPEELARVRSGGRRHSPESVGGTGP
jgi:hypothetical protein